MEIVRAKRLQSPRKFDATTASAYKEQLWSIRLVAAARQCITAVLTVKKWTGNPMATNRSAPKTSHNIKTFLLMMPNRQSNLLDRLQKWSQKSNSLGKLLQKSYLRKPRRTKRTRNCRNFNVPWVRLWLHQVTNWLGIWRSGTETIFLKRPLFRWYRHFVRLSIHGLTRIKK